MVTVSSSGTAVSYKTEWRFPETGQTGHFAPEYLSYSDWGYKAVAGKKAG